MMSVEESGFDGIYLISCTFKIQFVYLFTWYINYVEVFQCMAR